MADQEFLASFAVEIDEGGVSRLQTVLEENRTLANEVASAFEAATAAILACQEAALGGELLSASLHEASAPVAQTTNQTVSAPVTIQVRSSGADPEQVGQKLYDTAERYLLRTLSGAMA